MTVERAVASHRLVRVLGTGRRRSRLGYTVAVRQTMAIDGPVLMIRVAALSALLTVFSLTPDRFGAALLSVPAMALCVLRFRALEAMTDRGRWRRARIVSDGSAAADRRRRRRGVVRWVDVASALLVLWVAAWWTTALDLDARLVAVGAAVILLSVVCLQICVDPRWYRPEWPPRRFGGLLRQLAGVLAAIAATLIALPAPWSPDQRPAVVLLASLTLSVTALTRDQDLTCSQLVRLIHTEAQDGRQVVLDETHGALSTNLRLLEQRARELRAVSPRLYELAVSANSRLRETLTLGDPERESAAGPDSLVAVLNTLALAVGARAELTIRLHALADDDRDLVRLVLNDLVGAALARGAGTVEALVRLEPGAVLAVSVADDGPVPEDPLERLGLLAERLAATAGRVAATEPPDPGRQTQLTASWPAGPGTV
jgi:hypothetical protein